MIKRHLFRAALCNIMLLSVSSAFANGDPVAIYSAITLSPTPVAVHIPEVQLEDEYVTFTPRDRYMDVYVRYLLHNKSDRAFKELAYGFPIDYLGSGPAKWKSYDGYTESEQEVGWRDGYIQNVNFTLDEKQLTWKCSRDSIIVPSKKQYSIDAFVDVFPDSADDFSKRIIDSLYTKYGEKMYWHTHPISRRWYYTYLNIPAQSYVVLEVHYSVECAFDISLYGRKNNMIYYDFESYSGRLQFQYDFTPAAYWGDGHANHFFAVFDASEINIDKRINKQEKAIKGLPMYEKNKRWYYETQHFDLAASKPFRVDYYLSHLPHQHLDRLLNHRIPPTEYTVEVSGSDVKYPVSKLFDLNPATTTVLQPDANDSVYITIKFKKTTAIEGLLILNGYTKNTETYRNNARIDSMYVLGRISPLYKEPEKFETELLFGRKDWIVNWTKYRPLAEKYTGSIPDFFDWQTLADNAMQIYYRDGFAAKFTEIRIVITAAAKGLKYDDLCVSEILLIAP